MDNALKNHKRWVKVVLDTPIVINDTTGEKTYNFSRPIRNPKISCNISGSWHGTGSGGTTTQVGFGGSFNIYGYWHTESGNSGNPTYTEGSTGHGTSLPYQVTDNIKRKKLTVSPWISVWGDLSDYSYNVTSSSIWITEYEEYR